MMPEEGVKTPARRRKEEAVRYQSENEIIIQPLNVKEPKSSGVPTLLNIAIGLVIGIAASYFLLVRSAESRVRNEEQQVITKISSESDAKTARIQELENQISDLNEDTDKIREQLEEYVGVDGTLQITEELLQIAAVYVETKENETVAAALQGLAERVNVEEMTEGFQSLFRSMNAVVVPELAAHYLEEGNRYFNAANYPSAVEALEKAVFYDAANEEALYQLAQSYRITGDKEKAIAAYDKVIELFPDSWRAENSKSYKEGLN